MPLIIVTGKPCSGKSRASQILYNHLKQMGREVEWIREEELSPSSSRQNGYRTDTDEKRSRGMFYSQIERQLSSKKILIADGLNYIKGFRYQLYCLARSLQTTHLCLNVICREDVCLERNVEYPPKVIKDLFLRFEEANSSHKWDSPLVTVNGMSDDSIEWLQEVLEKIALTPMKASLSTATSYMNTATPSSVTKDPHWLEELSTRTETVVREIWQKILSLGVPLTISSLPSLQSTKRPLVIRKNIPLSLLQSQKRQYQHLTRIHPVALAEIESSFFEYLVSCNK